MHVEIIFEGALRGVPIDSHVTSTSVSCIRSAHDTERGSVDVLGYGILILKRYIQWSPDICVEG